ncbi:hypothetical protein EJB05_01270, partial [Eragrostis curvula]
MGCWASVARPTVAAATVARLGVQLPPSARPRPLGPGLSILVHDTIREAGSRGARPVFYPAIGTTSNSCEEARDYYNLYSWEMGFGIRYHRSNKNGCKYRTKMDIVCSCEGRPEKHTSSSCRTQCKAMIRVRRTKDHGWFVSTFVEAHNHPFFESCGENKQWGSHGDIDAGTKDFIRRLRENNVSIGRVCSILGVTDGSSRITIRKEVVRSVCAKLAQDSIKDDIGKTQALLDDMKSNDSAMEVRFNVDAEGSIKSMLWCTGKNRDDFNKFGDVVTFDTTYRTNLYNMPFGLFVGVNNHFQSTVFGGVLLRTEKTEDFVWAFSAFLKIMDGKAPQTILTDQCQAMEAAIKTTIPSARHRWCRWHVLKKAKEYLGHVYSKYSTFKKEFHHLITFVTYPREFELGYKLGGNKYLKRLFKKRSKWAKPYFMGVFCAGMTSTQRSESANHMLKRYIPRSAPMHLFVRKFSEFQFDREDQECKEKHFTKQKTRPFLFNVPIEKHAKDVYTRAMYNRFHHELYEFGAYAIEDTTHNGVFVLVHTDNDGNPAARRTRVTFSEDRSKIDCECGLYEHMGMLCRHALKVLVHLDRRVIPCKNIMKRWTKDATKQTWPRKSGDARRSIFIKKALELANANEIPDDEFLSVLEAIDQANIASAKKANAKGHTSDPHVLPEMVVPLQCPLRPTKRGRPGSTSLRSWEQGVKRKRKNSARKKAPQALTSEDEENPYGGKTRSVQELVI